MNLIPNAASRQIAMNIMRAQKHSPKLLFAAGVVGVVGTTVLACRSTLKLGEVLEDAHHDIMDSQKLLAEQRLNYTEANHKKAVSYVYGKTAMKIGKLYAPAIGIGILSVGALTGSHIVLTKRNVALTAAYATVEKGWSDYREKVVGVIGAEEEQKLRYDFEVCEIDDEKGKKQEVPRVANLPQGGYAAIFDQTNRNWMAVPESNALFLRAQQEYANHRLRARGYLFLSDVYDSLGIPQTKASRVVGWIWNGDGDNYVDFGLGDWPASNDFINAREGAILLDFNVDGTVWDKI